MASSSTTKPRMGAAQDFVVVDETSVYGNIVEQLSAAAYITGVVTAEGTGLPIAGVAVHLCQIVEGSCVNTYYGETDAAGVYFVGTLPIGDYFIQFWHDNGLYVGEYLGNHTHDTAVLFNVTTNVAYPNVNEALTLAAYITGQVTDGGGAPLEDIGVAACQRDEYGNCNQVTSTQSDASGEYHLDALPAGEYQINFYDNAGMYLDEFYPGVISILDAQTVVVNVGETATGIDASLEVASHITGQVVDSTGAPAAEIHVAACDPAALNSCEYDRYTYTDENGLYDIAGLREGAYIVSFWDTDYVHFQEYYDGAFDLASAQPQSVGDASTLAGIDASLTLGAVISGTVVDPLGNPVEGATVALCAMEGDDCHYAGTGYSDANGDYVIRPLHGGDYLVSFEGPNANYLRRYYPNAQLLQDALPYSRRCPNNTTSRCNAGVGLAHPWNCYGRTW